MSETELVVTVSDHWEEPRNSGGAPYKGGRMQGVKALVSRVVHVAAAGSHSI